MRMHDLSGFSLATMERLALVTICLFSTVFLVWFLVALLLDEKRIRKAQGSSLRKSRMSSLAIQVETPQVVPGELPAHHPMGSGALFEATIGSNKNISSQQHRRA